MPDLNRLNTVSSTEELLKFQTSALHSKALSSPYLTCDSLKPSIPCREHRESAVPPPMAPLPPPLAPVPPLLCALTTAPSPPDAPSTLLTLTRAPRVPFHEHVLTPAPVAPKPLLHASAATPCLAFVRAPCSMPSASSPSTPTTKTVKGNPASAASPASGAKSPAHTASSTFDAKPATPPALSTVGIRAAASAEIPRHLGYMADY